MQAIPFLMFQGSAKDALLLWQRAIPSLEVLSLTEHTSEEMAGQIEYAEIKIGGSIWRIYDSPPVHKFTFTPSSSIFIECDDETQLRSIAAALGDGGEVLMPIDNYGFSQLYTWLNDPFGVSWQINLPGE